NTGGLRGWLVSGTPGAITAPLTAGPNRRLIKLVGPNSTGSSVDAHVSVETEPIIESTVEATVRPGNFAYWIGDEGVKATVNFDETLERVDTGRQRQMLMARPRVEELSSVLDPAA